MPSALNACRVWPWIVCFYVCDCMFVEITHGPMTSLSRVFPSIRANYCIWGMTKHPQHCWEPQQPSRSACSLPHMAQHAYNTIQNMWAAPHVCTCTLWTLSRSHAQPHDLPALEEVVFRKPHLYLSLWGTFCQKVSQHIGKVHYLPHLLLMVSLSQWQRWCGCPMLPSSSWLPNVW